MKLKVGDNYSENFVITQEMVNRFAELSGDKNPLHLDKDFAAKTGYHEALMLDYRGYDLSLIHS